MDEGHSESSTVWGLGYGGWAVVYCLAMVAAVAIYASGLVPKPGGWWVMLVPLVLVVPMSFAQMGWLSDKGVSSPALTRYGRDFTFAFLVFFLGFFGSARLSKALEPSGIEALSLALLSALPALAIIWIAVRYLRDEEDEFLHSRAIFAALCGLVLVLAAGTVRGFLELFGVVGPISAIWVFPTWAVGVGLGNGWQWMRGR